MSVFYYSLSLIFCVVLFVLGLFFNKKSDKGFNLFLKIISVFVFIVFTIRYMYGTDAIQSMFKLGGTDIEGKVLNFFALMLVWFSYASNLIVSLYGFFKFDLSKKLIKYFTFPMSFLSLIFMFFHFDAIIQSGAINQLSVRGIFFAIETGCVFGYSCLIFVLNSIVLKKIDAKVYNCDEKYDEKNNIILTKNNDNLNVSDKNNKNHIDKNLNLKNNSKCKKSFFNFICNIFCSIKNFFKKYWFNIFVVLIIFLSVMPAYTISGIFGFIHQSYKVKDFEIPHRIILYISIILPFIVHFSLNKKDYQT